MRVNARSQCSATSRSAARRRHNESSRSRVLRVVRVSPPSMPSSGFTTPIRLSKFGDMSSPVLEIARANEQAPNCSTSRAAQTLSNFAKPRLVLSHGAAEIRQSSSCLVSTTPSRMNDQRVVQKLIEIARDQKAPMERRKRAIGWLSRSKDPQVLKFLEELL